MSNSTIIVLTDTIKQLFDGADAFVRPDCLLSDLDPAVAVAMLPHSPHSIAGHIAHAAWWQRQVLYRLREPDNPQTRIAGDDLLATVSVEEWPAVLEDFLSGLEALKQHCDNPELLAQNYPNRDMSVHSVFLHFALHNAYHLGQVLLLRRLQQAWPPAGYDPET
jgi:uncharacterized damage-inducible protein DinB